MESKLLFIPVLICASCALISFSPTYFNHKKKTLIILWSVLFAVIITSVILLLKYLTDVNLKYLYVYTHCSQNMTLIYKISSLWAGEEGCFLLWALIMCIGGYFVLFIKKKFEYKAFGIFCVISFFIILICFILNPFEKISVVPYAGLGINEILKSPWMAIHPPLIFFSYGAMAVLFSLWPAFSKHKTEETVRLIKLWIYISMFFLTSGIISGCIWTYHSYAYGKVWAWDSIENISLITWLILCGFIHRDKYDTQAVCVLPFSSACFGVFLARSGVLEGISYHLYTESNIIITQVILFFIFGAVLFLDIQRRRSIKNKKYETGKAVNCNDLASEAIFIFAGFIFLGTIAPIISKTHTPVIYYVSASIVFVIAAIFILLYKEKDIFKKRGAAIIIISAAAAAAAGFAVHEFKPLWLLFLLICFLPISVFFVSGQIKKRWIHYLTHIGVIILITGAVASNAFGTEGYALKNQEYDVNISGVYISANKIESSDIIILSKFNSDTVIQCVNKIRNTQGGMLIPYTVKPLIILFWAGCILLLMQPVIQIVSLLKDKEDKFLKEENINV